MVKFKKEKREKVITGKKFKFSTLILTIFLCLISFTSVVYADDSTTHSIVGDWFNKVFDVNPNDGSSILDSIGDQSVKTREEINNSIYNDTVDSDYSLYDRFGGDISFIPYFGETKISTGLLDRFYTKFLEVGQEKFDLSADDVKKLFESSAISNNVIYDERQDILSTGELENGNKDPRVSAYSGVSTIGGEANIGNALLTLSNFGTTTVGMLSGSGLFISMNNIWQSACDAGITNLLQTTGKFLLPILMAVFVVMMITKGFKVAKGQYGFREFITTVIGTVISLGFIYCLMVNPAGLSGTLVKVGTSFDNLLDNVINVNENEIVKSSSTKNVRVASLWKNTVFDPWCQGMFGADYDHLYTQYDTEHKDSQKMKQDHDDVNTAWTDKEKKAGKVKYNSINSTGDVKIKLGKTKTVRNWAALAWSCQSIYHIDAVDGKDKKENETVEETTKDESQSESWPKASTTPMNKDIFVDNFRWLDAKLNISPEYHDTDKIVTNYSNSNDYTYNFISNGNIAFYRTLLLIPILCLSLKKLSQVFKIISSGFKWCADSALSILMPDRYNVIKNISNNMLKPLYDFFWWSVILFIAITTYNTLIGKGILAEFIWLLIGFYMCKFAPIRTPRQLQMWYTNKKRNIKVFTREKFESLNNYVNTKMGK